MKCMYRDYKYIVHIQNELIGSIHSDGCLTITNYLTGDVLRDFKCSQNDITAFHKINNDTLSIGTIDGVLKIINWQKRAVIKILQGHNKIQITGIQSNSQYLVSASQDGQIIIWSLQDYNSYKVYKNAEIQIEYLCLKSTSVQELLIIKTPDNYVYLKEFRTYQTIKEQRFPQQSLIIRDIEGTDYICIQVSSKSVEIQSCTSKYKYKYVGYWRSQITFLEQLSNTELLIKQGNSPFQIVNIHSKGNNYYISAEVHDKDWLNFCYIKEKQHLMIIYQNDEIFIQQIDQIQNITSPSEIKQFDVNEKQELIAFQSSNMRIYVKNFQNEEICSVEYKFMYMQCYLKFLENTNILLIANGRSYMFWNYANNNVILEYQFKQNFDNLSIISLQLNANKLQFESKVHYKLRNYFEYDVISNKKKQIYYLFTNYQQYCERIGVGNICVYVQSHNLSLINNNNCKKIKQIQYFPKNPNKITIRHKGKVHFNRNKQQVMLSNGEIYCLLTACQIPTQLQSNKQLNLHIHSKDDDTKQIIRIQKNVLVRQNQFSDNQTILNKYIHQQHHSLQTIIKFQINKYFYVDFHKKSINIQDLRKQSQIQGQYLRTLQQIIQFEFSQKNKEIIVIWSGSKIQIYQYPELNLKNEKFFSYRKQYQTIIKYLDNHEKIAIYSVGGQSITLLNYQDLTNFKIIYSRFEVYCLEEINYNIIVAGAKGTISIYDQQQKIVQTLKMTRNIVYLSYLKEINMLIGSSLSNQVIMYEKNEDNYKMKSKIKRGDTVTQVIYYNELIFIGDQAGSVVAYNYLTNKYVYTLQESQTEIFKLFILKEQRNLVVVDINDKIIIWNLEHKSIISLVQASHIINVQHCSEDNTLIILKEYNQFQIIKINELLHNLHN